MGIIVAIAFFITIVGIGALLQRHDASQALELDDQPKRTPLPGARDAHAVTGMLGRAAVPSWG